MIGRLAAARHKFGARRTSGRESSLISSDARRRALAFESAVALIIISVLAESTPGGVVLTQSSLLAG